MALYSLNYDLVKQRDYQKLYDELANFNAVRVTESQWFFKRFDATVSGLREHFSKFIDSDDRLMVAEIASVNNTPQWAGRNLLGSPNKLN